jgi:hypothetical protein
MGVGEVPVMKHGAMVRAAVVGAMAGGLALAAPAGSARADEPGPDLERGMAAQQAADQADLRADELAIAGGWAWKCGAVERAERDATRMQAEADAAFARAGLPGYQSTAEAPSPDLAAAQDRLSNLENAGGWAWKSGSVRRAKEEVRALTPGALEATEPPSTTLPTWNKPVVPSLERDMSIPE